MVTMGDLVALVLSLITKAMVIAMMVTTMLDVISMVGTVARIPNTSTALNALARKVGVRNLTTKGMGIAMMEITMLDVTMMVEIAVLIPNTSTALFANVFASFLPRK